MLDNISLNIVFYYEFNRFLSNTYTQLPVSNYYDKAPAASRCFVTISNF